MTCIKPADGWWKSVTPQELVVDFAPFQKLLFAKLYAEVREGNSTATATVIDTDDEWAVDIHLEVSGPLGYVICGYWCISCCLDNMCGDRDYRFPQGPYCCELIPLNPCGYGVYDTTICVPGNVVKESECGAPYEATVIVTVLSSCLKQGGNPKDPGSYRPLGVAGSFELPMLTFYDDTSGPGE